MSNPESEYINELETIIRSLADVWPSDRNNVMEAGAKFEEVVARFDFNTGQLQKLIDLAWRGMKHLYEKDDFFMSVKMTTMQAVNTIRESLLNDGDIPVEDFEKACHDLEKALSGKKESADTLIDLDPDGIPEADDSLPAAEEYSLDDLASLIMKMDESSASDGRLNELISVLDFLIDRHDGSASKALQEALSVIKKIASGKAPENWFSIISDKIETAIHVHAGEKTSYEDAGEPKKNENSSESNGDGFSIPQDIEPDMAAEYVSECSDLIDQAESALLDLETSPGDEELINTIFRAFHTIKGTSAFMGLDPISEFTHLLETLLSMVRESALPFDRTCADITFEAIDMIKQMLEVVENASGGDPFPLPAGYEALIQALQKISDEEATPEKAFDEIRDQLQSDKLSEKPGDIDAEEIQPSKSKNTDAESTVRVNVGRLDRLIDMVGELVIAHSVVAQEPLISKHTELQKKVNHTSKILRELQDTSLTLRMVPLKATFHKMNRLVRDISRKAGKPIKLHTIGEDTEIDRNMVDIINEPLVHMLRNAIDHGIEELEERKKTDKPETASVWLRAFQEGGKVVIEIEDDGRGIDKDKILEKAVSKGLVEAGKKLSESEIYNLIFLPGFSSKDQVTDLSGRGVGMDVVKRSIEELQGKINVSSEKKKGTKISIELPFTLAITDGMLVRVGGQKFIVPTINIDMTFRAKQEELFTVFGNSEQVKFRKDSIPVIRLHRVFDIQQAEENLLEATLLVIKNSNKRYGLMVDEVIGQQQLVGKSINIMVRMPHISGGAILGDGRVGLILDTATLMN